MVRIISDSMDTIRDIYWKIRQTQSVTIAGVEAKFEARVSKGGDRNRMRIREEYSELADIIESLGPDDIFYDIGANTGLYSCFAGKKCSDGEVYAFEPYPPNVTQLNENISLNGLQNVHVFEIALSDSFGVVEFDQPSKEDVGFGSAAITSNKSSKSVKVATHSVDGLISEGEIKPPNVVKIDVEGAEPLVVSGMEQSLKSDVCRLVFCEYHLPHDSELRPGAEEFGMSLDDMKNKFEELGYKVTEPSQRFSGIVLKCEK